MIKLSSLVLNLFKPYQLCAVSTLSVLRLTVGSTLSRINWLKTFFLPLSSSLYETIVPFWFQLPRATYAHVRRYVTQVLVYHVVVSDSFVGDWLCGRAVEDGTDV